MKHFSFGPLIMSMHFKDSLSNNIERERWKPSTTNQLHYWRTLCEHDWSLFTRKVTESSYEQNNDVLAKLSRGRQCSGKNIGCRNNTFFGPMWLRHFNDTRIFINRYPCSMLLIVFLPNLKRLYEHLPKLWNNATQLRLSNKITVHIAICNSQ